MPTFGDNIQCKWMPHSVLSAPVFLFLKHKNRKKRKGEDEKMKRQWTVCLLCPTSKRLRVRSTYACRQLGDRLLKFDQTGGRKNANPKIQMAVPAERGMVKWKYSKNYCGMAGDLRCELWWQPLRAVDGDIWRSWENWVRRIHWFIPECRQVFSHIWIYKHAYALADA